MLRQFKVAKYCARKHVFQAHKGIFRYDDVQETPTISVLNLLNLCFEVSSKIQIRRDELKVWWLQKFGVR